LEEISSHVYNRRDKGKAGICHSALKEIKIPCTHNRAEGKKKEGGRHACSKKESKEGMKDKCSCDL
jgi:hypothetical protein